MMFFDEIGQFHEFIATQRIAVVGVELLEQLVGGWQWRWWRAMRRTTGAARATTAFGPTWASTTTFRTALTVRSPRTSVTSALTHMLAHFLTFFVAQFSVAVFVEFLSHAFLHCGAGCLAFFIAELAIAVFIVLFEHPLAHLFATWPVAFAAAVFGRLRQRGQRRHASSDE
jgi:hypothetical protein